MIARLGISLTSGVVVTFALLWLMQFPIATGRDALSAKVDSRIMDFIRGKLDEQVEQKDRKPSKPDEVADTPAEIPPQQIDFVDPNATKPNLARV